MVDTIERAIHPFSVTAFFFGPGIFRYPLHNSRPYFNFCYTLSLWSVYVYGLYKVVNFWPKIFSEFLIFFTLAMSFIVTMISIIITIRKQKNFHICIRKLVLVDDTLEKLGTPKEYHKIRNSVKQMLIIWFMMICVTLTSDSLFCIEVLKDKKAMLIPVVMNYCLYINTFMDIIFVLLLRYIGTRFNKINKHISRLSETEEYGMRCTWKKSLVTRHVRSTENCKHVVWIAM
ncbi:uncharacterized protein LOC109611519 [Ooceraea biroi]|nr:uncharacterized protein LOC109611519 [Ooceraea biroi]